MTRHLCKLAAWAVAVGLGYLAGRWVDPRPWVALVIAAGPAVVCSPLLLLGLDGVAQARRWGRWADDGVRAAWGLDGPPETRTPGRTPSRPAAAPTLQLAARRWR